LTGTGDTAAGARHRDRALRIAKGLQNVPAAIEVTRSWDQAIALASTGTLAAEPRRDAANVLQGVAALLMYVGRPDLLAPELVAVIEHAGVATGAVAVMRDSEGIETVVSSWGESLGGDNVRVFPLGTARNATFEVRVQSLPDFESRATLNSITMLLGTVRDLEQAKAEREERLTLWPSDELPSDEDEDQAVITGRMRELMAFVRKIAPTNVPVLITGESGTGKEVLARAIHKFSSRAKRPFVPLNCTAVPRELLESQLFGHRRGAFTGADRDHLGVIRAAKDGTLFLDEIGELSLELQPKLLRFLESGEISPLGEANPFNVDVRIVAATNANLERLVESGRFREDLYYRLNVICVSIPPLRERRDEIPPLVHHFTAKAAGEFGKGRVRVSEETMEHLTLFPWPGNVRQLQNELRRMVALADVDGMLTPASLARTIRQETASLPTAAIAHITGSPAEKLTPVISRIEREMILAALRANAGRAEATAKALGISRKGLYLKRQRLGI
jgi:DNA-binding NtrC family response regulator